MYVEIEHTRDFLTVLGYLLRKKDWLYLCNHVCYFFGFFIGLDED